MENPQRATVAFLCGYLNNRTHKVYNGIYDNTCGCYVLCNLTNNGGSISVFDHNRKCFLTGRFPSFYDYGVSQYINLTRVNDNMFSVFDYHTCSYLSLTCQGASVTVFDYSIGRYFNYQLS